MSSSFGLLLEEMTDRQFSPPEGKLKRVMQYLDRVRAQQEKLFGFLEETAGAAVFAQLTVTLRRTDVSVGTAELQVVYNIDEEAAPVMFVGQPEEFLEAVVYVYSRDRNIGVDIYGMEREIECLSRLVFPFVNPSTCTLPLYVIHSVESLEYHGIPKKAFKFRVPALGDVERVDSIMTKSSTLKKTVTFRDSAVSMAPRFVDYITRLGVWLMKLGEDRKGASHLKLRFSMERTGASMTLSGLADTLNLSVVPTVVAQTAPNIIDIDLYLSKHTMKAVYNGHKLYITDAHQLVFPIFETSSRVFPFYRVTNVSGMEQVSKSTGSRSTIKSRVKLPTFNT